MQFPRIAFNNFIQREFLFWIAQLTSVFARAHNCLVPLFCRLWPLAASTSNKIIFGMSQIYSQECAAWTLTKKEKKIVAKKLIRMKLKMFIFRKRTISVIGAWFEMLFFVDTKQHVYTSIYKRSACVTILSMSHESPASVVVICLSAI